ncbi:MAG: hypothetical protein AMJ84_14450 [Acidithiobacillales bacterium SM23_46]|nr:MAG: hypothetical protein AMJ84_14450 [Acidithiobacillales bacterium SM23_46]
MGLPHLSRTSGRSPKPSNACLAQVLLQTAFARTPWNATADIATVKVALDLGVTVAAIPLATPPAGLPRPRSRGRCGLLWTAAAAAGLPRYRPMLAPPASARRASVVDAVAGFRPGL